MIEIIVVIALCTKMGNKMRDKGRSAAPMQVALVVAWVVGEILGAVVGFAIEYSLNNNVDPNGVNPLAYFCALGGAVLGAGICFMIAGALSDLTAPETDGYVGSIDDDDDRPAVREPIVDSGNPYASGE